MIIMMCSIFYSCIYYDLGLHRGQCIVANRNCGLCVFFIFRCNPVLHVHIDHMIIDYMTI